MKRFRVKVREVHIQEVEVEARNENEAIKKVAEGEGEYVEVLVYSHSLDPNTWTVKQSDL